jgi:hypothetical protein
MVSEKGQEQQDVTRLLEQLQERMATAGSSTEEEWTDPTGGPLGDLFKGHIPRANACACCRASGCTLNLVSGSAYAAAGSPAIDVTCKCEINQPDSALWSIVTPEDSLFAAMESGDAETAAALLKLVSAEFIDSIGPEGDTLLHIACLHGHEKCAEILLDNGAAVTITDEDDGSVLHDAAAGGCASNEHKDSLWMRESPVYD